MLCAVVLIVFVRKYFEFEFFVRYCAWAVVCSVFNTCANYKNSMVLR